MEMKRLKRPFVSTLASVLLLSSISQSVSAAGTGQIINYPNPPTFKGRSFSAFGGTYRSINYYQVSLVNGAAPAFCIEEGEKLPDNTVMTYEKYEAKPGQTAPVMGSFDRYLPMAVVCERILREGNYHDTNHYAVTRVYMWGCTPGYKDNWPAIGQVAQKLVGVLEQPCVISYYEGLKRCVIKGVTGYEAVNSASLPSWSGTQQKVTLKDRRYKLAFDTSTCPQLKDITQTFPDSNRNYQLSSDGNNITFIYDGAQEPIGTISSAGIGGIETTYYAYIFPPPLGEQVRLSRSDTGSQPADVAFNLNQGTLTTPDISNWEVYRHSETFESNYNIGLEKCCAEINQPSEGTIFNVWEDFDSSQINEGGYIEEESDGTTGEVYLNCVTPEPESDYVRDTITIDTNGQTSHSDVRFYNYSKTYCMEYPAPE